jgi:hypothetical protein
VRSCYEHYAKLYPLTYQYKKEYYGVGTVLSEAQTTLTSFVLLHFTNLVGLATSFVKVEHYDTRANSHTWYSPTVEHGAKMQAY